MRFALMPRISGQFLVLVAHVLSAVAADCLVSMDFYSKGGQLAGAISGAAVPIDISGAEAERMADVGSIRVRQAPKGAILSLAAGERCMFSVYFEEDIGPVSHPGGVLVRPFEPEIDPRFAASVHVSCADCRGAAPLCGRITSISVRALPFLLTHPLL